MDNNFNRVRLCGRAAGEPALSHINHGEHFYRFPLSVERLSGQERAAAGDSAPAAAGGAPRTYRRHADPHRSAALLQQPQRPGATAGDLRVRPGADSRRRGPL